MHPKDLLGKQGEQLAADFLARSGLGVIERNQKEPQALIAIGRIETDPGLKRKIVEHLIDLNTPEAKEYLLEVLK